MKFLENPGCDRSKNQNYIDQSKFPQCLHSCIFCLSAAFSVTVFSCSLSVFHIRDNIYVNVGSHTVQFFQYLRHWLSHKKSVVCPSKNHLRNIAYHCIFCNLAANIRTIHCNDFCSQSPGKLHISPHTLFRLFISFLHGRCFHVKSCKLPAKGIGKTGR